MSAQTSPYTHGAAIISTSSLTITLASCVLKDCTAKDSGGALYLNGGSRLTVTDTLFYNCVSNSNEAEPGGGGIFITGSSSSL